MKYTALSSHACLAKTGANSALVVCVRCDLQVQDTKLRIPLSPHCISRQQGFQWK